MPTSRPVPGLESATDLTITTADGVALSAYTLPAQQPSTLHLVVAHGFTNHSRRAQLVRVVRRLSKHATVTAFDFRGHGRSTGACTAGGDGEVADIDAVVAHVRAGSAQIVGTVGFSMGASSVVRHAALGTSRPDLVVAVSPVSRWYTRDSKSMRRVHWLLESQLARRTSKLIVGTKLDGPWTDSPPSPVEVVDRIAPAPLLLVHGAEDRYFGAEHSKALHRAAGANSTLWVVDGFDHAESSIDPVLTDRIGSWIANTAATKLVVQ